MDALDTSGNFKCWLPRQVGANYVLYQGYLRFATTAHMRHALREIGFKQVKWIEAIEFVESFDHLGFGQGGYNEDHEFYGYRMPI
ncbi:hypothetical protein [Mycobacterium montefiorense]|uniref:Uncharacterized protein n=1 Tax=Mycobacterium montefiorense TaxID=154654 RepID=A0AA37PLQ2_9MYCO|nr:hypothetical protein [Mycobacterium montefiorense]GBG40034.1 hypothetical protein MmonteBS_44060 [Mycobacterium montefiorense]GKU33606.1 hypothetical protein NJB14191_09530 [Mycobacterium montefiorense]GKU39543.1 hypothetical protein NJB14192_15360 [Mycobacterium montefiorense]GKU43820.1 hypothetical protein NJB14194_04530 [Mycobacterium montefiorense]GKU52688.1 hypothetical protein NJB14195_39300 [Mycobacterium montefiorense]